MSEYSKKQEKANIITHAIGIVAALVAIPILLYIAFKNNVGPGNIVSLAIYCFSLLLVFSTSTIYHSVSKPDLKKLWRKVDHIGIYFLIAGSATPIIVRYVEPTTARTFLIIQWSLVLAGTIFKLFFTGKFKFMSTMLYIGMGLLPLAIGAPIWKSLPLNVYMPVLIGGVFYIGGTFFYLNKKLYYHHAVWHVFVLGGSIAHMTAIGATLS